MLTTNASSVVIVELDQWQSLVFLFLEEHRGLGVGRLKAGPGGFSPWPPLLFALPLEFPLVMSVSLLLQPAF